MRVRKFFGCFLLLLIISFGATVSAGTPVPAEYKAVEKALKKEYKDVKYKEDFFTVREKDGNKYAAFTLEGKQITPFYMYIGECNITLQTIGEYKYIKAHRGLYSFEGELVVSDFYDYKVIRSEGQPFYVIGNRLYDSEMQLRFSGDGGEIKIKPMAGDVFYETVSNEGIIKRLYSPEGKMLEAGYLEAKEATIDGQKVIEIKDRFGTGKLVTYDNSTKEFVYYVTKRGDANKSAKTTPGKTVVSKDFPSLEIIEGTVRFVDSTGFNVINADGVYALEFQVRNIGKGPAKGCAPVVRIKEGGAGISVEPSEKKSIAAGETIAVSVPVKSDLNTEDGTVEFAVKMDEPSGFGTEESLLSVTTHAFEAPKVLVNDYTVISGSGATLQKKVPFDLQLLIQNIAHGRADDVTVSLEIPNNVFLIEGKPKVDFGAIQGGQTKEIVYTLVANTNYTSETIPVKVDVHEKHGKYAESRDIELKINQPLTSSRIVVDAKEQAPRTEIEIARLNSDVDVAIPSGARHADNTFVVIIANENYSQVASVPHAANDGHVFAEYCRTTLGVPERNIRTATNATLNEMRRNIEWLAQVGQTFGEKANLILYYSGHGIPDESTGKAYILPVDGYPSDMKTNLAVNELYDMLNESGAGRTTVFMDACFSGARRGDGMLMAARGVQIKAKGDSPKGNMVVFSAAQGDETAYPYESQNHGLFTYYLLKKLQQTGGQVSLGELSDYITEEVKKASLLENSKIQTPQVRISPSLAPTWRNLPL